MLHGKKKIPNQKITIQLLMQTLIETSTGHETNDISHSISSQDFEQIRHQQHIKERSGFKSLPGARTQDPLPGLLDSLIVSPCLVACYPVVGLVGKELDEKITRVAALGRR